MNFDEFINRETAQGNEELSRRQKSRIGEWLGYLDKLYETVKSILSEYIASGKVKIEESDIDIHEDFLGDYKAKQMRIKLGDNGKFVELEPIAALVIGSSGRVDMNGRNGSLRILLVNAGLRGPKFNVTLNTNDDEEPTTSMDQETGLVWRFATTPPNRQYIPLDKETFLDAVMKLAG